MAGGARPGKVRWGGEMHGKPGEARQSHGWQAWQTGRGGAGQGIDWTAISWLVCSMHVPAWQAR